MMLTTAKNNITDFAEWEESLRNFVEIGRKNREKKGTEWENLSETPMQNEQNGLK
ncbi:MAG: hypothetical protein LUG47_03025 [Clostridiales bacterium]|nr:hypothetical protein [Clostridiales bacterium]